MLTLGLAARTLDGLLLALRAAGAATVVDLRSSAAARREGRLEAAELARVLGQAGIRYLPLPTLSGGRRPRPGSRNVAWLEASFRGYADHMLTCEFEDGLVALRRLVRDGRVVLLCAEANPWRCHRALLSDALWARGVVVEHLVGRRGSTPHRPTPFAAFTGRQVTYPAASAVEAPARRAAAGARGGPAGSDR